MWNVRPSDQRGQAEFDWLDSKHTFSFGQYWDPAHVGFGPLRVINEDRITPGAGFPRHPHKDMEILSYVLSGAIEHKDSMGNGSVIRPGELQYMSAGSGVTHSEFNGAPGEHAHFYQLWIVPNEHGAQPRYAQIRIDEASRNNAWGLIAGGTRFNAPIEIRQDAALYSSKLEAGAAVTVTAVEGRQYWLQVVRGQIDASNGIAPTPTQLTAGDGLAIRHDGVITLTAREPSEALLFDLPTTV
jgi:redox-sensitive bicupin YhaK (pirin superfamily)